MADKQPSKWRTALRLALSVGLLLALLFFLVDLEDVGRRLRGADPVWLAWLLVVLTADRALMSWKWTLLVRCKGVAIGQGEALRAYYLGTFAGSFLPTTLGADALRVAAVSSPGRPSEVMAASVIMERALGLVASALAGLMGLTLLAQLAARAPQEQISRFTLLAVALGVGAMLALLFSLSRFSGRLVESLNHRAQARGGLAGWLGKFLAAFHQYRDHPRALALFLLLSLAEQACPIALNWLAALALHFDLPLVTAAAVTPVAIALARLPVWFSGFGVVEGLFVFFFGLVGVGATEAFLLGLATNVGSLVASLPGLFFYMAGGLKGRRG